MTVVLFLTGFAVLLTGMIAKFTYQRVAGNICLVAADYSFYQQDAAVYLVLAGTAVLVWIVPSFILRAYFTKQHQPCKPTFAE